MTSPSRGTPAQRCPEKDWRWKSGCDPDYQISSQEPDESFGSDAHTIKPYWKRPRGREKRRINPHQTSTKVVFRPRTQNPNLPDHPQNFRTSSVGGKEEGGKKNEMSSAHFFQLQTIIVIQHKKNVTWPPPCRYTWTISTAVEIVEKWTMCQWLLDLEWLWVLGFRVVCV